MTAPNMGDGDRHQALLRQAAEAVVGSVHSSRASSSSVGATAYTPPRPHGGPPSYNHEYNMFHHPASSSAMPPPPLPGFSTMGQMPLPPPPPPQHRVQFAPPALLQNSASAPSIPIIVSDDIVSGTKRGGWMSPVRRFFILLATFDFLFVVLMWVITIIVRGNSLKEAFEQQVLRYTIRASMFDCVIAAFTRFLICVLFYAVLDISHWWPVALTTACTSAFIGTKVFEYEWSGNTTFDVMLVLLSFILAWGEVWHLDFRVLPLEEKAKEIQGQLCDSTERTPLLFGPRSLSMIRYMEASHLVGAGASSVYTAGTGAESLANFYSPLESPEDSGDELEAETRVVVPRRFKRKLPLNEKEVEYRQLGEECAKTAWCLLNSSDWKLEKSCGMSGDTIHSRYVGKKKLFKLQGEVDLPAKFLLEELFYRSESLPTWNPTITEYKTIQPIDSHTDVAYQVSAEAGGGAFSPRDFVSLRHWEVIDGAYVSAAQSITHIAMPPQPKRVRGENGPSCWAMLALPGKPDHCQFQWLLDTDIKGWIPRSIIDAAIAGTQCDYMRHLRKYAEDLKERGRLLEYHRREAAAAADSFQVNVVNETAP